ncbi:hypothetical protein AKJ09_09437 [Labilithrix luteola]|uniref:Uncharacterized protein n=1 Tax=Labilithrix luteola TaxID=1391654 RepID=A0A0K1QAL2_9BACT|nr:hypothetical protein AKJ09_09437 [Labilithrix luteola]
MGTAFRGERRPLATPLPRAKTPVARRDIVRTTMRNYYIFSLFTTRDCTPFDGPLRPRR